MNANIIIIVILLIIIFFALSGTIKHMKGEGDCCGGPKEKPVKKKINTPKTGELLVHIDGMHCENCKNRIEKHLDELDGVVAKVNLHKKEAIVSLYNDISSDTIKDVIEKLDFTVTGIERTL